MGSEMCIRDSYNGSFAFLVEVGFLLMYVLYRFVCLLVREFIVLNNVGVSPDCV